MKLILKVQGNSVNTNGFVLRRNTNWNDWRKILKKLWFNPREGAYSRLHGFLRNNSRSTRWVDVLEDFTKNTNSKRNINRSDVTNQLEMVVWNNVNGVQWRYSSKVRINDTFPMSTRKAKTLLKWFMPQYSKRVFIVDKVNNKASIRTYKIKDLNGTVKSSFYY